MHLTARSKLLVISLYCLYLPAIVRSLPYTANQLLARAELVDLDPTVDETAGADDDRTTAATGTQDTSSDTVTGKFALRNDTSPFLTTFRIRLALACHPRFRRAQRDKWRPRPGRSAIHQLRLGDNREGYTGRASQSRLFHRREAPSP